MDHIPIRTKTDVLQEVIDYQFNDIALLENALRHRSISSHKSNERLEFLGDRVLGLVITEYLYLNFNESEGQLSKKMNFFVCKKSCAKAAHKIDLGRFLMLSNSEEEGGGRANKAILGDACEALLAAVYLDGGLEPARKLILYLWQEILQDDKPIIEPKSALQEWTQSLALGVPEYEVVRKEGPDHAPIFTIKVSIKGHGYSIATGKSHKHAENAAALHFLDKIKEIEKP